MSNSDRDSIAQTQRRGFGEVLPQFTTVAERQLDESLGFNFGLGDLRQIPGLEAALEDTFPREQLRAMVEALPGTQGLRSLNAQLAAIDAFELRQSTDVEDILLCFGACDGLVLSLLAVTKPGEGVVFAVPSFPYWWVFTGTGRNCLPLYFKDPEEYRSSFGDRVRALVEENSSVKAVVLNEPQNPMGSGLDDRQLRVLQSLVEEGRVVVIADDVARSFAASDSGWWRLLDPNLAIVVGSFTKRYAAPGLRLGWVRAKGEFLVRARNIAANWRVGVSTPVAVWGSGIIEALGRGELIAQEVERRRELLVGAIAKWGQAFPHIRTPNSGVYSLIDCRHGEIIDPGPLLRAAAAEAGIVLMGSEFLFPPDFDCGASRWMLRLSNAGEPRVEEGVRALYEVAERMMSQQRSS